MKICKAIKLILASVFILLYVNMQATGKEIELSQRSSSSKVAISSVFTQSRYTKVYTTLKGLSFDETVKTLIKIKDDLKAIDIKYKSEKKSRRVTKKMEMVVSCLGDNPSSLLSLLWPLFLLVILIWFISRFKRVFIEKIKF